MQSKKLGTQDDWKVSAGWSEELPHNMPAHRLDRTELVKAATNGMLVANVQLRLISQNR